MKFSEIVEQAGVLLQRKGRVTYRALKREFDLDDELLTDVKDELIKAAQVARDENGEVLVWVGDEGTGEAENRRSGEPKASPQPLTPSTQAEVEQEAEGYFLKAIAIAQKQQAKSLELRATMSLARLWQSQGKTIEAHQMLSEVYNWFTEGFDTKDLQEAKALLNELEGKGGD